MTRALLLGLAVALAPLGASGQEATGGEPSGQDAVSQAPTAPEAGPSAADRIATVAATPAALVADRVRDVLRMPADPEGWGRLADALPEMALVGQADWESTLEAARVADSVSVASRAVAAVPGPGGLPLAGWPVQPSQLLTLLTGLAVVAVLRGTVRSTRTSASAPAPGGTPGTSAPAPAPTGAGRRTEVLAMVHQGLPSSEIARRTGLAQDAVATLAGGLR